MGVYVRPDSKFYWLTLHAKGTEKIRERTSLLVHPDHRQLAEQIYRKRMKELARSVHFAPNRARLDRADASGWTYIYFVSDGKLIKIGRAVNVLSRLRAMQTSSPKPLTVLATFLAHYKIEGVLQRRFQHLHVTREWFRHDPELLTFIDRVKRGEDIVSELVTGFTRGSQFRRRSA